MSKKTANTVFPFFVSDPLVSTPDNSNLLQFSLKVRVIKIRLCICNGVSLYRELNAMKNFSYFGSMRCLLEICKFFCMCLLVKCIFKKEEDHLFINQVKPLHQTSSSFTKKKTLTRLFSSSQSWTKLPKEHCRSKCLNLSSVVRSLRASFILIFGLVFFMIPSLKYISFLLSFVYLARGCNSKLYCMWLQIRTTVKICDV